MIKVACFSSSFIRDMNVSRNKCDLWMEKYAFLSCEAGFTGYPVKFITTVIEKLKTECRGGKKRG